MPVAGGILVARSASRCLYSAAGMLRFLARLSGRRRHVRRYCGGVPGAGESSQEQEVRTGELDGQFIIDPGRISEDRLDDVRLRCLHYRQQIEESRLEDNQRWKLNQVVGEASRDEVESITRITGIHRTSLTTGIRRNPHDVNRDNSGFSSGSSECHRDDLSRSPGVARFRQRRRIPSYFATLLVLSYTLFGITDACSSRSTPKPRPPTPTPRPNITFHMYTCPPDYAEWYCLNGATCFTVKIQESLLYNCLCANGFIGQRCEFKDLDGSYLPSRQRVMLETASIAGGATIAVFLVVIICIAAYIHCKRKQKELRSSNNCADTVDGPGRDPELRPFSNRSRSLMIFMAKNQNSSSTAMCPSIEQTRMPVWNDYSQVEMTRLASISEPKRSSQ
ncbi:uncharacterized protein [Fopius arisanus]|uniref:Uncharacterized protein isoform X2 n=1 Tax=Fopius arisanus TaxID=64838 RepID=A0A9R1STB2_9HYME|nr:PREDICTED: uncharacterized protein LOC105262724 isoform X2 [Fopius arisanus]XP_011296754.1 PREDICTED: uncharacterized protein LOC105262724 isoform X2 [Fopius arisanus]